MRSRRRRASGCARMVAARRCVGPAQIATTAFVGTYSGVEAEDQAAATAAHRSRSQRRRAQPMLASSFQRRRQAAARWIKQRGVRNRGDIAAKAVARGCARGFGVERTGFHARHMPRRVPSARPAPVARHARRGNAIAGHHADTVVVRKTPSACPFRNLVRGRRHASHATPRPSTRRCASSRPR